MEGKSSTQSVRFFTQYLPIAFMFLNDVAFHSENFLKTLKCSSGHVECSFDNPVGFFLVSFWKTLLQIRSHHLAVSQWYWTIDSNLGGRLVLHVHSIRTEYQWIFFAASLIVRICHLVLACFCPWVLAQFCWKYGPNLMTLHRKQFYLNRCCSLACIPALVYFFQSQGKLQCSKWPTQGGHFVTFPENNFLCFTNLADVWKIVSSLIG